MAEYSGCMRITSPVLLLMEKYSIPVPPVIVYTTSPSLPGSGSTAVTLAKRVPTLAVAAIGRMLGVSGENWGEIVFSGTSRTWMFTDV